MASVELRAVTDARRIAEKWLDGTGYTEVAYGVHALTEDETTTLAREHLAALDELDESERQSDGWRRRCFAAEDARDAALARVAALEEVVVRLAETPDLEWCSTTGWKPLDELRRLARAALAPSVPRTLETDLREDR